MLGIDPGTAVTGFGVIAQGCSGALRLVECGAIRTSSGASLADRVREIFEGVSELLERHRPEAMAVEDVFQGRNARSALTLGHARGVILLAGSLHGTAVAEYQARRIKSAVTGSGGATKDQVSFMVMKHLRLAEPPAPADAADGVAAAICHTVIGASPLARALSRSPS